MLQINKKMLNASLAIILALGLGGCGINQATTAHKTSNQPTSAKVVKKSANHKSANQSSKTASSSSESVTNDSATTQPAATTASQQATQNSYNNGYQQPATSSAKAASQAESQSNTQSQKSTITNQPQASPQLGLGDTAIWTDQYGVVHHVDSDGMDRMTIPGSDQVKYQDWYGPLPANAQIISSTHSNVQLGLGDVAVWTDEYGVVHHVDSDGMDRMTIPGSDQVKYQDWSGYLPSNAQVVHEN